MGHPKRISREYCGHVEPEFLLVWYRPSLPWKETVHTVSNNLD